MYISLLNQKIRRDKVTRIWLKESTERRTQLLGSWILVMLKRWLKWLLHNSAHVLWHPPKWTLEHSEEERMSCECLMEERMLCEPWYLHWFHPLLSCSCVHCSRPTKPPRPPSREGKGGGGRDGGLAKTFPTAGTRAKGLNRILRKMHLQASREANGI